MTVYLIGAGPGDAGLITVRGQAILKIADVIIHDRLVAEELLFLAKPDALIINVGKNPHGKSTSQEHINQLLMEYGHLCVARLKGGDPFVFGRGGEELIACQQAGIPVEVVPGVSSAIGVPAYAGVPVTHRDVSTSFTVVTGHERNGKSTVHYEALATLDTLVFLMGVQQLPEITANLIEFGRSPDTPVMCIEWGTYAHQRTVSGTLATMVEIAAQSDLQPPSIIVVGEVAGLNLTWEKTSSIAGDLIVMGRNSYDFLYDSLTANGAHVLRVNFEVADSHLWNRADKVILTSADEARRFVNLMNKNEFKSQILCVGSADVLWEVGLIPTLTANNETMLMDILNHRLKPVQQPSC